MTDRDRVLRAVGSCCAAMPEVLEAYVFGSVGRDEARSHSDVDVAVFLDPSSGPAPPFGWRARITADLMRALARNDVDVVILNQASPLLAHRVLRDGVRVHSRDLLATSDREARAVSRWCDWAPVQSVIDAGLLERSR